MMTPPRHIPILLATLLAAAALSGCKREDMHNQARHEWHEQSDFFADQLSSRPPVEGTVSREQPLRNDPLVSWRSGDKFAETYPFSVDRVALERGRQRYDIYCSMCHGATGYGDGMIVRRGFARPPSFHDERLRAAAPGYFVEVITHGYGAMYSYNDRVAPEDRWKIAAYVKTLQLSRRLDVASLTPEDRQRVEQAAAAPATAPVDSSRDVRRQAGSESDGMRGAKE
jgi:mono/diheme cytochrome c family protein